MNYIVPCLSDPQLAFSASSAFASICDTCRNSLVGELNNLMHVYVAMSNSNIKVNLNLEENKRHTQKHEQSNIMQKVVESVADVIQVLPPEQAMSPLMVSLFFSSPMHMLIWFQVLDRGYSSRYLKSF